MMGFYYAQKIVTKSEFCTVNKDFGAFLLIGNSLQIVMAQWQP